jgi:hypothetical protein
MLTSEATTAGAVKQCCACGVDVTGQARMKDSQSRYWCVPCGQEDQRRKAITSTQSVCAGCHKTLPKSKLDKLGDHFFCKPCLKKRSHVGAAAASAAGAASSASSPDSTRGGEAAASKREPVDRKRAIVLASIMGVLAVIWALVNFVLLP